MKAARDAGRCRVIVVNDCWRLAPWADALYACDHQWWKAKRPGQGEFNGVQITQDETAAARYRLTYVHSHCRDGLCTVPWELNQGGNSGFQAVNLAYHFGANRIVLIGFDMGPSAAGRTHWFGDHPGDLQVPSPYSEFIRAFGPLAEDLRAAGVDVANCTLKTALTCFRTAKLQDELK